MRLLKQLSSRLGLLSTPEFLSQNSSALKLCTHICGLRAMTDRCTDHGGVASGQKMYGKSVLAGDSALTKQAVQDAREIFRQAVNAVIPSEMIRNSLQLSADKLYVGGKEFALGHNVYVVGFGKAVLGMARALEDCAREHIVHGLVSVPCGIVSALTQAGKSIMLLEPDSKIRMVEGARNNMPDSAAMMAAQEVEAMARGLGRDDLLVVLISGGGSALLPSPVTPVTLEEMADVTRRMAHAGASIMQLNTVRKTLERLKGGGLAEVAQPAQVLSLILSDVIRDPLDFIASGPTVPNLVTPKDCLDLFTNLDIKDSVPLNVLSLLESKSQRGNEKETIDWSRVHNILIGTNKIACGRAKETSEGFGYESVIVSTELDGEVQKVAQMFVILSRYICVVASDKLLPDFDHEEDIEAMEEFLLSYRVLSLEKLKDICQLISRAKQTNKQGVCVITGGETTVAVKGDGIGGRNQEMALWVAVGLQNLCQSQSMSHGQGLQSQNSSDHLTNYDKFLSTLPPSMTSSHVVFLSAGTDGQDGPTPAAGAVVTPDFCVRASESGLNMKHFLNRNDSYNLLSQVDNGGNLVMTGLTGTNVMDVQVLMVQFDT